MDCFSDTIVFESPLVRIGAFRCPPDYANFEDTGPIQNDCFVFPRTEVAIEHEHERPFAANPNVITFYNRDQRYRRRRISNRGDCCEWFAVDRAVARDATRTVDPSIEDGPFPWTRAHCDARIYYMQRRLFSGIVSGRVTDPIEIEESVIRILDEVIGGASARPKSRALIEDVEHLLSTRFDQPVTLPQISEAVGISVFHLCRSFRRATGFGLHEYIKQLRIRHGLEQVSESRAPLAEIAVNLGFAHHSHFTSAFRREFGVPPSSLRC
jgi:AraC-like DNA-binding protein